MAEIAVWDWEREPVPDARVVVCLPGMLRRAAKDAAAALHSYGRSARHTFISTELWSPESEPEGYVIPALYAERPPDLARLPDLLAVKAERRALVLCPQEAIDIAGVLPRMVEPAVGGTVQCRNPLCSVRTDARIARETGGYHGRCYNDRAWVDLVVIIPPPEARACPACGGAGSRKPTCDASGCEDGGGEHHCFVKACAECRGCGFIGPWPVHPAWVRGIVEQCRAASVPVICMTEHLGAEVMEIPEWLS